LLPDVRDVMPPFTAKREAGLPAREGRVALCRPSPTAKGEEAEGRTREDATPVLDMSRADFPAGPALGDKTIRRRSFFD
jgi:hypothetical protein